jgi:putative tryptophan/tyrosine transport system substrate-binding protein
VAIRRHGGIIAALALLAACCTAQAQPAAKVYRIGFVTTGTPGTSIDSFREGMKAAGYEEGRNITIESRFASGRQERLPELVAEVIAGRPDVLVVSSTRTAIAAKHATSTIPIVFASVFDPVASGLVASLARPGGNLTGTAMGVGGDFGGKWVELLKEAVPNLSHAAVLWNSANQSSAQSAEAIQAAARKLGVKLAMFDAGNAAKLDAALKMIAGGRFDGLVIAPDPHFNASRTKLVQFAARRRLPAVYFFRSFADAGGLMAYGANNAEAIRAAAKYVDRILKGAKPAELPVDQPTRFDLVINAKTAKALGLKIPQSLLVRADHVIQ